MSITSAEAPRSRRASIESFFIVPKLVFVKIVQFLEVSAIPYLAGIALAVGGVVHLPEPVWRAAQTAGVLGTVAFLYVPVVLFHAGYDLWLRARSPGFSLPYFLEDKVSERVPTLLLAAAAAVASFFFGVVNYHFAVDRSDPQHLSYFVTKPWDRKPVVMEGRIIREPEFRDRDVWLYVQPATVTAEGLESDRVEEISGGLVLVKVGRTVKGYEDFDYGQRIRVSAALVEPSPATNPGVFDYKQYLGNRNIFGLMTVYGAQQIQISGEAEASWVFRLSLWVKERLLSVMKATLPYPHSAFQGGIIYGLKTGLPQAQHFEFKWAGMAWVLVVAGAHLLMVYLTLKMILESLRPPPQIGFIALFGMLFIFLILTGINPPTVRAFIMLFLYEFTKTFLGQDIRAAVRSAISIAAFLLLASHVYPYFSPLMIFDPTVTLSFGAVLSLSYLSRPIERIFRRYLYGLTSMIVLTGFAATIVSMAIRKPPTLSLLGRQTAPIAAVTLALAVAATLWNNRFRALHHFDRIHLGYNDVSLFKGWRRLVHPECFSYNRLPKFVLGFLGAQVAIQFGMVMPLSSWYFMRSPIGGLLANIFAFPALGAIIQVGLIADLVGLVPIIGSKLAFVLNAGDWIGIEFLIQLAHWSKVFFPYPMAMKPTGLQLTLYYGALVSLVLFDRIFYSNDKRGYATIREVLEERLAKTKGRAYAVLLALANTPVKQGVWIVLAVVGAGAAAFAMSPGSRPDHLRVTFMDLRGGGGTVIEAPGGVAYLVDAGKVDLREEESETLMRTEGTVLLSRQIEHVDGVFLTSLKPENVGGIPFILENFTVGALFVPFDPKIITGETAFSPTIYESLGGEVGRRRRRGFGPGATWEKAPGFAVAEAVEEIRRIVREREIPVERLVAGTTIGEGDGEIRVLNPSRGASATSERLGNEGFVLQARYAGKAVLLGGDVTAEGEDALLARGVLRSDVLLVPAHGSDAASSDAFISAVAPKHAIVQFAAGSGARAREAASLMIEDVSARYGRHGASIYRTDLRGAVVVDVFSDGGIEVSPMVPEEEAILEDEEGGPPGASGGEADQGGASVQKDAVGL